MATQTIPQALPQAINQASNPALKLRDIHLPDSPSIWPLAPGWWILLAILIILGIWLGLKLWQRSKQKKHLQQILNQYQLLENRLLERPDSEAMAAINVFLRQLAIENYPRTEIASLTGTKWLEFLDQAGETKQFTQGAGRLLIDAPYRSGRVLRLNLSEFTPLIKNWIKKVVKTGGVGHVI